MTEQEKLTTKSFTINGFIPKGCCTIGHDGSVTDELTCADVCGEHNYGDCDEKNFCPIQEAFDRLAEYEATGLSPAEITELISTNAHTPIRENPDNLKHDDGKTRLDLVEPSLIEAVGRIRTFGVRKYAEEQSWRKLEPKRITAAAMRHWEAYRRGEELDPESGMPHLWHVACNIMFLIEMEANPYKEADNAKP